MPVDKRWSKNRVPHRTLYSGSRGLDVAQLQHALNHRAKARSEFGYKPVKADGEFGAATRKLWVAMAKAIGLDHRKCTPGNQLLMRRPGKRRPAQVKRSQVWLARTRAVLKRKKAGTAGERAVKAAGRMVGKVETGQNDGPWLRQMERDLLKAGAGLGWMIPGQPYCGFGCDWSWLEGGNRLLPDGVVYTPNICPWGGSTKGRVKFTRVSPENAKPGALVVCNFGSGGAKHVALARGRMRGGSISTREFNTSPGNSGSQANGGGCWDRSRTRWQILCTINVEAV